MENIGDWLYLVIIIIAAISSFIGSINKKNKQTAPKQQPREIITEDWEKEFRDNHTEIPHSVFREKQKVVTPQLHVRQTTNPDYHSFNKTTDNKYATYKKEIVYNDPNIEEESTAITIEDMPANTDEWRKAFIYNEIFKRKY